MWIRPLDLLPLLRLSMGVEVAPQPERDLTFPPTMDTPRCATGPNLGKTTIAGLIRLANKSAAQTLIKLIEIH